MRCALWPGSAAEHRAELATLAASSKHAAFIAHADGAAAGFAEATLRDFVDGIDAGARAVYLDAVWVDAPSRRQGVATALLDAVIAWGMANGAGAIGSDADIDNPAGAAWHRARGFDEVGRTTNFAKRL